MIIVKENCSNWREQWTPLSSGQNKRVLVEEGTVSKRFFLRLIAVNVTMYRMSELLEEAILSNLTILCDIT